MKKFFSILAILVVLGLVLEFLAFPMILSSKMTKMVQVPTKVSRVGLRPLSLTVTDLVIDNAPGYSLEKALIAEKITIEAPLYDYFQEEINIETITIDNIYLGLEFNDISSPKGNWTALFANLQPTESEQKDNPRKVTIKRLVLNNIKADVYYRSNQNRYQIPPIEQLVFTDISSENGIPTEQIMKTVLGRTLKAIFEKENINNMLEGILKPKIPDILNPFSRAACGAPEEELNRPV